MNTVAIKIGKNRRDNILRALENLKNNGLSFSNMNSIFIKPNLLTLNNKFCNTAYETVESTIDFINSYLGIKNITVGAGSSGAAYKNKSTWETLNNFEYPKLERRYKNVSVVNIDELPHNASFEVDTIYGTEIVKYHKPNADILISIAIPKTHDTVIATGSSKNVLGFIRFSDRAKLHGIHLEDFKNMSFDSPLYKQTTHLLNNNLFKLCKNIKPNLAIIDGLWGVEGDGPGAAGKPIAHGFAAASENPISLDHLTFKLMGFDTKKIGYINALNENNDFEYSIIGDSPNKILLNYKPHKTFEIQKKWHSNF